MGHDTPAKGQCQDKGDSCDFLLIIRRLIKDSVERQYQRLLAIETQAVRERWSPERIDAERDRARTTVKMIALQLPGLQAMGWSVRRLERWLKDQHQPPPRQLLETARLEHAKRLLREELMPVDEVAYRMACERRALDDLFRKREGLTAAQWQGWRQPGIQRRVKKKRTGAA